MAKPFGIPAEISRLMLKEKFIDFIDGLPIPNGCPVESMTISIKIPGALITERFEIIADN